jgi:toxin ParE1/3/4
VKSKPIFPRELASRDVEDVVDYYLNEAGEQIALGFVDALEQAYLHIASHPASGSPRYAHELNLPGLRYWPVQRYPYLVFYVELSSHVDIWRVLHGQRDIPAWLLDDTDISPDTPY